MIIQTERLLLVPLSVRQLDLWVNDLPKLEQELRCTYEADPLVGKFGVKVKEQLMIAQEDSRNYLFHSFWFVMKKADRVVIGSADFKGVPNENGEVEIACGVEEKYHHLGFMTEAIEALCHWAKTQPMVRTILADTKQSNPASSSALEQCGFYMDQIDEKVWWRLA